jgi:hypothetical protein
MKKLVLFILLVSNLCAFTDDDILYIKEEIAKTKFPLLMGGFEITSMSVSDKGLISVKNTMDIKALMEKTQKTEKDIEKMKRYLMENYEIVYVNPICKNQKAAFILKQGITYNYELKLSNGFLVGDSTLTAKKCKL